MPDPQSPADSQEAPKPTELSTETPAAKSPMPPATALLFVIAALIGVLIVVGVRTGIVGNTSGTSADLTAMKAELDARRNDLNRQRVAMGLTPLEGGSEPITEIAKRLKTDADTLVALSQRFQEMLQEKDTEISAKSSELLRSEQLRQSLSAESVRLQGELQRALVSGSNAEMLGRDIANLKSQRDALASELSAVREQMKTLSAGVSNEDYAALQRRHDETQRAKEFFEARVKELEGDLTKTKLFANSENELLPAAVTLFRNLRELENRPDSELTSSYSNLGVELGANVLHTFSFATGSSGLAPADEDVIRGLVNDLPDGDLLLSIGYASETGSVDSNRILSSDRATAVAELYSGIKRPGQLVQAVYLGQTDRFSSRIPERNQLVEIWRIRKK